MTRGTVTELIVDTDVFVDHLRGAMALDLGLATALLGLGKDYHQYAGRDEMTGKRRAWPI